MYDYMLEEMADAVSRHLPVENAAVLRILADYWQDKIAHVWQVEDVLEAARRIGRPITRLGAVEVLQDVFRDHNSSLGITWQTLEVALQDYRMDFANLSPEDYPGVHGVFKVWVQQQPVAHQFGLFPNRVDGNLPETLAKARQLAAERPGALVFVSCESPHGEYSVPWLVVGCEAGRVTISEGAHHV